MNTAREKKKKVFQTKSVSVQPRWNKKGKRGKRDQLGERGMKRAKWHLEERW